MFFLCGQDGPVKHPALRYFTDLTAENRPDFRHGGMRQIRTDSAVRKIPPLLQAKASVPTGPET